MEEISVNEAARRLNVSWRTLQRWLPGIPHRRDGRRVWIRVDDLEQWVDSRKVEPGTIGHLYPQYKR